MDELLPAVVHPRPDPVDPVPAAGPSCGHHKLAGPSLALAPVPGSFHRQRKPSASPWYLGSGQVPHDHDRVRTASDGVAMPLADQPGSRTSWGKGNRSVALSSKNYLPQQMSKRDRISGMTVRDPRSSRSPTATTPETKRAPREHDPSRRRCNAVQKISAARTRTPSKQSATPRTSSRSPRVLWSWGASCSTLSGATPPRTSSMNTIETSRDRCRSFPMTF